MSARPKKMAHLTWVYVSGAAFLVSLLVAGILIVFSEAVTGLGIRGAFYYVLLIPLGLCSAAFLFGAMRSHAKYVGKSSYGTIELTGPVVVFALVVLGGFYLAEPESTFSLTVNVHGPEGPGDLITDGRVMLELDDDRRTKPLNSEGQVVFNQIPAAFLARPVRLIPMVERYRARQSEAVRIPPSHVIDLEMERVPDSTTVRGTVFDAQDQPVEGALLNFDGGLAAGRTDAQGTFRVTVPREAGTRLSLVVTLDGRAVYDERVTVSEETALRIRVKPDEL